MLRLNQLTTMWEFPRASAAMLGDSERPELSEMFTGVDQKSPADLVASPYFAIYIKTWYNRIKMAG